MHIYLKYLLNLLGFQISLTIGYMKVTSTSFPKGEAKIVKISATYSWIGGENFHTGYDLIIRRCIQEDELFDILKACHDEPCGGHFVDKRTAYKVLHLGYYWPTLFKYAKKYVRSFDSCQRMSQLGKKTKFLYNLKYS